MIQWPKNNDSLGTVNRGNPCESGLCTLCVSDCKGKCETWMSSLRGRKMLYPRNFGNITSGSGNVTSIGVGYHSMRIQGYAYGAEGLNKGMTNNPDDCVFPNVNVESEFGSEVKVKCRMPIMTGALGSTIIAEKYWRSFATGAAISGFPIVIGENVVGVDKNSKLEGGKIKSAPELDRRLEIYKRYYDGYGSVFVQMNVEDTRNGVAEYIIDKYGDDVIIELKWGQGAKVIGGEIQVKSIDYALFLKDRGYVVDPDPRDPAVQSAFERHAITAFARHSRLGSTDLNTVDEVRNSFMESVAYLRSIGFKRISLKTGSYGMEALAMAIRYSADANLDLLTIDGSGGGTGMSPWNMMEHWGIPSLSLHAKVYDYCKILEEQGINVPDISLAGGFAREDHIFKALALCAPYAKMVCMGRAPMIPGYLGANIEGTFYPERKADIHGHWESLPQPVKSFGKSPEEIFAAWEVVKEKIGADEMKNVPFGAVAMAGYVDKLSCGLQQLMAGVRKFKLSELTRNELFCGNRETEKETGIPFMTEAQKESAEAILRG